MNNRQWLDRLQLELSRRKLPKSYMKRLIGELSDHFHDLTEENMSTESLVSRLGQPEQIADAAARCRRGFFRRHRWLRMTTFVVLPVPLLILCWALTMAVLVGVAQALGADEATRDYAPNLTWIQDKLAHLFFSATVIVPATFLAGGYCLLARLSGNRQRWGVAAGIVVAVFAGLVTHQLTLSEIPGKSTIMFGLGFPPKLGVWQVLQFAVPLVAVLVCRRNGTALTRRSEAIA